MKIEICVHCYNFQYRLNWFLNSILNQKGDIPDIVVNISYAKNNGDPTTESVIDFFRKKGLKIVDTIVPDDKVLNRAFARNIQVSKTKADWVLLVDGDMVYEDCFFERLKKKLKEEKWNNEKLVAGCHRHSLNIDFCVKYFEESKIKYPCIVEDLLGKVKKFPVQTSGGGGYAAGYFQLANVRLLRERNIEYPAYNDNLKAHKFNSDRAFRVLCGGRTCINEVSDTKNGLELNMWHLNHDRGAKEMQR